MRVPENSCGSVHYLLWACKLRKSPVQVANFNLGESWPPRIRLNGKNKENVSGRTKAVRTQIFRLRTAPSIRTTGTGMFNVCTVQYQCVPCMWLMSTWLEASVTEELSFPLSLLKFKNSLGHCLGLEIHDTEFWVFTEKKKITLFTLIKQSTPLSLDPKTKLSLSFTTDIRWAFYN